MKIGLALGSGGARGLAHISFLKVLDELNIKPSLIAGSSIGALIGAMYSSGLSGKEIENIFKDLSIKDFAKIAGYSLKNKQKFNLNLMIDHFKKFIKEKNIEDLKIPLKIVVTDINSGKECVITKGPLIQSIKASMAYPIIFKPVKLNNKFLIDGGTVNPLPYDLLNKSDITIAIDISKGPSKITSRKLHFYEVIFNPIWIMQNTIIQNKLKISRPDIYIKPNLDSIKIFEFNKIKKVLKIVEKDSKLFKLKLKLLLKD